MTEELLLKIDSRNLLKKKLDRDGGSDKQWKEWKVLRNKVNRELKAAKREYLNKNLQNQMKESSNPWKCVKNHLG